MSKSNYGIDDISSLSTLEGFRLRPQMYVGSNDIDGTYQAFKEIINNATDEALMGYGAKIIITVNEEKNEISVLDEGRGVPFGIRKNGENVLISIYTGLHVGGKFNHKAYANSAGCNGCGGSAVCAMSEYFIVESYKEGRAARAEFKKGVNTFYKEFDTDHKNGTYVFFKPDVEVFSLGEIGYTYEKICQEIENIAYLNKGVRFIVQDLNNNRQKEFYSKNGIADFIKDKVKHPIMRQPIIASMKDTTDELEIAFMWSADPSQSYVFVNGLYCPEGGTPLTGAKASITQQVKRLSKKEFDPDVIRKGLVFAINCKVQEPSFANQTKSKINNPNLRTLASQAFKDGLERLARTPEFDVIINTLNKMQKAENAANKARQQVMETAREIEKNSSKKVFNSDKLKDAEKLGPDSTLLLVEGDSAAGAMAQARDITHYGILALRGKILNPLSNSEERIAANDEITLLLKALNIVPGKYDSKKLRYGRVAICTDSDSDGFHIGLLVASVLHYMAPSFLLESRLCWLRSPLYIVKKGEKESYYFTDQEMDAARPTVTGVVQRNKGLGSLSPDQAHRSMFTPEFQRMDVLEPSVEAIELLENLMGDDVEFRRQYIFDNIDFQEVRE